MAVTVLIPTPLQNLTNGQAAVQAEGSTVSEVMNSLEAQFPGVRGRLYDDNNRLRRFVNVYVNSEDIRFQDNEQTAVKDGDELSIIPAIAGGC